MKFWRKIWKFRGTKKKKKLKILSKHGETVENIFKKNLHKIMKTFKTILRKFWNKFYEHIGGNVYKEYRTQILYVIKEIFFLNLEIFFYLKKIANFLLILGIF